jgi:hypothetical protein
LQHREDLCSQTHRSKQFGMAREVGVEEELVELVDLS